MIFESVRFKLRKYGVAVLPALLVVVAAFLPLLANLVAASPGLYLDFKFFSPSGTGYVDETSLLRVSRDTAFCIRVYAVVPPPGDTKFMGFKCFRGEPTVYISYKQLEPVQGEWLSLLRERGVPEENIRSHSFGLLVRALVINVTSGEVLYDIVDSIPVTLGDLMKPQAIQYTLHARKNVHQLSYVKKVANMVPMNVATSFESSSEKTMGSSFEYCVPASENFDICYDLVAEVKPETLQAYLPSSYFRQENNRLYMKTPVLIAENPLSYSGVVGTSIAIDLSSSALEARLTFAPGDIISGLRNGVYPSVDFQLGGSTWGGANYYYHRILFLAPQQSAWAYIWARPIQQYWQIYRCTQLGYCWLVRDEVDSFITDILVYGTTIQGGEESGLPGPIIMENFYSGTNETQPYIPGTYLDDGRLDPGESIALQQIIQYYDTCGSGFEVGIPAGALAASAVCSLLGIGAPACGVATAFASAFVVSLDFQPSSIYISGGLQNLGVWNGIGYNITEYVFMRISRYQYQQPPPWWCFWCSPCRYSVPAGIYFRFW